MGRGADLWGRWTGLFALVFLGYAAGAVLSWLSFGSSVGPAFFFPSAGVAVATMLLTRRSSWPAILAAVVAAEVIVDLRYGNPKPVAFGYALANVIEPLVGASLVLAWCRRAPDLRVRRDLLLYVVAVCMIGPLFGGLIGGSVSAHYLGGGSGWPGEVMHWWAGDAIGALVVATPILLWSRQSYILRRRPAETVGVLLASAALSVAAFRAQTPPSMLMLPILAWAALRLDMLGASLAGAVMAVLSNVMTSRGYGMFADMDVSAPTKLAMIQVFIGVIVVIALLIAQEAAARMTAVREREAERRERLRLETLARLSHQLSGALTPDDIGQALTEHVINDAGARSLNLGLLSRDRQRLEWVVMAGLPPAVVSEFGGGLDMSEATVAADAARTGQPVLVPSAADYGRRYASYARWQEITGSQAVVGWPLTSGDTPIGVLVLAWDEPQALDPAQLAYISAVATIVSQALIRARIYSDEHARAAVLQAAVLPTNPGATPGLDVCVSYEPADVGGGVGGDWYDVMALPKQRTYLSVGDVVGHGLPAVEDMAQLRTAGRALAHQGLPPDRLLAELNGFARHVSHGKFATMAVAVYDPATGVVNYGTAGHPPPLLRRAATGEVMLLSDAHGPVLGPLEEAGYSGGQVDVAVDDVLVMYTDGLVERPGTDVDSGVAHARSIVAAWDLGAALSDEVDRLRETLAPSPRGDDICIVAVRFAAEAPGGP